MNKKFIIGVAALLCSAMLCGCSQTASTSSDNSLQTTTLSADTSKPSESSGAESTTSSDASDVTSSESTSEISSTEEISSNGGELVGDEGYEVNGKLILDIEHPTLGRHSWGLWLFPGWGGENYASYLNEFKEKVGSNVNVFNMIIPTASEYYTPEKYSEYNASQMNTINNIANNLVNVFNIDAASEIAKHTDEYIYFRTDHHWQALGAYYAAKAFADTAVVEINDLSAYTKQTMDGFVGALYALSDYPEQLKNDPDTFTYYVSPTDYQAYYYTGKYEVDQQVELIRTMFIEPADMSDAYCIYMGGDTRIVKLTTGNTNGRKLCLFKDSFGSALAPFLIDGFEEVYICDVRFFDCDAYKFIEENGITDVLFNFCTFSTAGQICGNLRENVLGYKE